MALKDLLEFGVGRFLLVGPQMSFKVVVKDGPNVSVSGMRSHLALFTSARICAECGRD